MLSASIVIPVKNAARTLPQCLQALQRLDPMPSEILFVDNGSTDESPDILETFVQESGQPQLHLLSESRPGASAARNRGIFAARGEVVAFLDADCIPERDWLARMLEGFRDPAVGAVAGRVMPSPADSTVELFCALYTLRSPEQNATHSRWTPWTGGFPTANFAVRRSLLEGMQGFDEQVQIYGEDYDLCARLYQAGASIAYLTDARVLHQHRTTLRGMLKQAFGFGRSHPYLLRRHGRGAWLELPWRSLAIQRFPLPLWINLASADKKALTLLLIGAWYRPALWLMPLYAIWLMTTTLRRAQADGVRASILRGAGLAGLLVSKSFAMTVGRWWGSIRYGAVCL